MNIKWLAQDNFSSPYSTKHFLIAAIATFLCFMVTTTQALFPVVLAAKGLPEGTSGIALSATGLTALSCGVLCGWLLPFVGPVRLVIAGLMVILISHIAFEFLDTNGTTAITLRLLQGIGVGLYLPSIITLSTAMLRGRNKTFLFGVFTTAILGANIVGPPMGELYFYLIGPEGFFYATAFPGVLSLLLYFKLWRELKGEMKLFDPPRQYFQLLGRSNVYLPLLGMVAIGILWGYVTSFLSVFLTSHALTVSSWFIPMTFGILLGRYVLLGAIQGNNRKVASAVCIAISASSLSLLALIGPYPFLASIMGLLFGISYSLNYPIFVVWVTELFSSEEQGPAIALSNSVFSFFMYLAPAFCAMALEYVTITTYQSVLGSLVLSCLLIVFFFSRYLTR